MLPCGTIHTCSLAAYRAGLWCRAPADACFALLSQVSFIFYGYSLLIHIQYHGRTLWDCDLPDPAAHPDVCHGYSGKSLQQVMHLNRDPNE